MKTYRILVVENDIKWIAAAEAVKIPGCVIEVAPSFRQAAETIGKMFFHAAFVDMHLDTAVNDGKLVLEYLARKRPSCRRFLFTERLAEAVDKDSLQELLRVGKPLIEGVVSKPDIQRGIEADFQTLITQYLEPSIDVDWGVFQDPPNEIVARLNEHLKPARSQRSFMLGDEEVHIESTRDELNFAISTILGQTSTNRKRNPGEIQSAHISALDGHEGLSHATILKGRPKLDTGTEGIWLVFKIDEKNKIEVEKRNFLRFVRWTLKTRRRVEMLSACTADTIGVVCYAFAHANPSSVMSLHEILRLDPPIANKVLDQILLEKVDWYLNAKTSSITFAEHFSTVYGVVNPRAEIQEVHEHLVSAAMANKIRVTVDSEGRPRNLKSLNGEALYFPRDWLATPVRHSHFVQCVVHGDLNLRNILIAVDDGHIDMNSWVFLDYAFTGEGPAVMDFVILQTDIMLATLAETSVDAWLVEDRNLLSALTQTKHRSGKDHGVCSLMRDKVLQAMKRSLEEAFSSSDTANPWIARLAREFAIASVLWGIRLLRIKRIPDDQKLRIIVWITALNNARLI